jgi:isoleucyl-tRNA synthetase
VSPELIAEGTARDVIRVIQQARRDAGLDVSDRITLVVGADGPVADAVRAHAAFVARETLATDLTVVPAAEVIAAPQPVGDGGEVRVTVAPIRLGGGLGAGLVAVCV